jgi:hypothetical protein
VCWLITAGLFNILVEILKLVNEELLYSEIILSDMMLVYKVLIVSANILLIAAVAINTSRFVWALKKEEEK